MDLARHIEAVLAVFTLLAGVVALGRRKGWLNIAWLNLAKRQVPGRQRQLEMLERISLGTNQSLHLVRFGSRSVLIATSPSGSSCCLLCEEDNPSRVTQKSVGGVL